MNISLNETIESEFLKFKGVTNVFPNGKDYVGLYEQFKQKFDTEIHPEVKTKILEIEKEGYYNDHGVDHIKMVIDRVSRLLNNIKVSFTEENTNLFYVSPYELFILLMAIQLHDTGHLIASREDHAKKGKELLSKFDSGNFLSAAEKKHIGDIARAHGGKKDPIGLLPIEEHLSHQLIRPQFIAALLRLGDELAEDKTRASNFLLQTGHIEPTSEIFHLYSASIDSININGGEIKINFYIEDKYLIKKYPVNITGGTEERYLIDEIYNRTFKTFTESLYCSRFLPEKTRINCVKVNINLLSSSDHEEIKKISYELKEHGYPLIPNQDIFSLCASLNENGHKLDGEFINNFVTKKV